MKILLIHSDFIEFEARKRAIKNAENWDKGKVKIDECLVVFTAVEKKDEGKITESVKKTLDEVEKIANEVKADKVVFYPYAHLSNDLSSPATAMDALIKLEEGMKKRGMESTHAPFGWYKAFTIKAKGHPLSELSREIGVERKKGGKQPVIIEEKKELSEFDHRTLGKKLDLFSFNPYAPGMTIFHANGNIIKNSLIDFSREIQSKNNYKEIFTPLLINNEIWHTSGHWDHYQENMFFTSIDDYGIKPMNCPGAIMCFNHSPKSYRDLPMKLSEYGIVHRNELSGVLSGLFRLREFTQDDAHIFVSEEQLQKEVEEVINMIDDVYKTFGFEYHVELSTQPKDSIGSDELWKKAEKSLESILKNKKMQFKINKGDGAFYGPKIDFHIKDSIGRTWQCATVQIDFMGPERFNITYTNENNESQKPVIIHRVIYGSVERFIGILIEHFKGAFPVWMSPIQISVNSFADRNEEYCIKIYEELKNAGIRVDINTSSNTVDYKIREAELNKVPYIIVVGDKEQENNTIAVRKRGSNKVDYDIDIKEFISDVLGKIVEKSLEI